MKKILIIAIFFFLQAMAFGDLYANKILPKEYYEIRSQLQPGEYGYKYYEVITYSREKELEIIKKLFDILKNYKPDTQEIIDERYYIKSAFYVLMPITEYKDYAEAFSDDFRLCDEKKRRYYLILKEWTREEYINFIMKEYNYKKELATEIVKSIFAMSEKQNYEKGKLLIKESFNRGIYNFELIKGYFEGLKKEEKDNEIIEFFETHFDKIKPEEFDSRYLGSLLWELKEFGERSKGHKKYIYKFFDKINKNQKFNRLIENTSNVGKDYVLDILFEEYFITDNILKEKVIEFLRKNKEIIDNREEKELMRYEKLPEKKQIKVKEKTKKFLIENKEKIGYKTDIEDIISIEK